MKNKKIIVMLTMQIMMGSFVMGAEAYDSVSIDEGVYFLNVEADNHFVMNVNGGYSEEGTNIDISPNKNIDCQKFQIIPIGDEYYRIVSVSSGLDVTIANGSADKEANVQIAKWTEGDNQKWRFLKADEDRYLIESALGTYIDNYGGNLEEGNNVWMYEANGSATQMWMLTAVGETDAGENGTVEIVSDTVESFSGVVGEKIDVEEGTYCINVEADNSYVLNVNGNYTDDGATIDIMPNVNADCQKFEIKKLEDGYYSIIARNSGKALYVAEGNAAPETDLRQWTFDGSESQKWEFIYVDENRIKIRSALGTYIDNYGGNIADANNVWMYGESESASQLWMLTKIVQVNNDAVSQMNSTVIADYPEVFSGEPGERIDVEEGIYCINVEADNSYVLDVNGNYTNDGATIDIMPNVNADCQKFEIKKTEDGYYTITAQNSGKVLDVAGGSAESEIDLQQRTYDGSDGQKWEFIYVDENRIKIRSVLGTYIDNYGGNIADANNVWMYGESDSASQLWMLTKIIQSEENTSAMTEETVISDQPEVFSGVPGEVISIEEGVYCINVEADNSYVLDVNGNYTDDGATIDIMPNVNADCQKFEIKKMEDGYYTIIALNSGKVLDVAGGKAEPETDLQQRTFDGSDGQKWEFVFVDENRVKIRSALGTYIDNYGGNIADANNVWMYGESESASQIWMLTKVLNRVEQEEQEVTEIKEYISFDEYDIIPDGQYSLLLQDNEEYCFAFARDNEDNGAALIIERYDGNPYQQFEVKNLGDNTYRIICMGTDKSIDIDGGSMVDGAKVQQWDYDGTSGQIWIFEAAQESGVIIKSKVGTYIGCFDNILLMSSDNPVGVKIISIENK